MSLADTPMLIQPVANGWALFPAWMAAQGQLDFKKIRFFEKLTGEKYSSDAGSVCAYLRELQEDGSAEFPPEWIISNPQMNLPLDTPSAT